MVLIPIIIIAITAGFLVFLFLNKPSPTEPPAAATESLAAGVQEKQAVYEKLETQLFEIIEQSFDKKYTREIREGEVSVGMPAEFLLMAWGNPARTGDGNGEAATWVYTQPENGEQDKETEVRIFQKKVQSWKDI
ncbi:hypothetical protein [Niabella beijingensis]|uniref:hypothetical protein n=1 Tax=Niabella beijingensis TaxID=2872700 RepID=UPI001CBBEF69|nr:hypothetical protein [Niabella beijingensis]MBZ4188481.1 hypothetical protein [Niabella beijingensis]